MALSQENPLDTTAAGPFQQQLFGTISVLKMVDHARRAQGEVPIQSRPQTAGKIRHLVEACGSSSHPAFHLLPPKGRLTVLYQPRIERAISERSQKRRCRSHKCRNWMLAQRPWGMTRYNPIMVDARRIARNEVAGNGNLEARAHGPPIGTEPDPIR